MGNFWQERKIDIFKDGVSVPGLTMKYLFSNVPGTFFSLLNEKDKDLYYTMKANNVGGPSIIFNRYHEKDKTFIREVQMRGKGEEPKPCQKVVGYDANMLYLWAIMQDMPTGQFSRRLEKMVLRKIGVERWQKSGWNGKRSVDTLKLGMNTTIRRKESVLVVFLLMGFTLNHKLCFSLIVSCCFSVISWD